MSRIRVSVLVVTLVLVAPKSLTNTHMCVTETFLKSLKGYKVDNTALLLYHLLTISLVILILT